MAQGKEPEDNVGLAERIILRKIAADSSDAIRVVDDRRQSVSADFSPEGEARYEIKGRSRQNEDGVLDVCQILAEHLRRTTSGVGQPRPPMGRERGVDCEIPTDKEILEVQVTRPATPNFWRTLNTDATADRKLSLSEAVSDILALIEAKAKKNKRRRPGKNCSCIGCHRDDGACNAIGCSVGA